MKLEFSVTRKVQYFYESSRNVLLKDTKIDLNKKFLNNTYYVPDNNLSINITLFNSDYCPRRQIQLLLWLL